MEHTKSDYTKPFKYKNSEITRAEIESFPCPFCTKGIPDEILKKVVKLTHISTCHCIGVSPENKIDFSDDGNEDIWYRELEKQLLDAGIPYYEDLISRQFLRKNPDGSFTRGYGYWEDMAEKETWDFVCQFLPGYERRDDVMTSDDLACVIDGEKSLGWLYEYYPQWDGLTIEELKKVRTQWDYELMQEAEGYLTAAIQSGKIEIRDLPVSITSARIEGETRVWLWFSREDDEKGIRVGQEKLQRVYSRVLDEDGENMQVLYTDDEGKQTWMYAQSIDFE